MPEATLANIEALYGLNRPFYEQVFRYVWNIVAHFDFGPRLVYRDRSVSEIIAQGFPVTLTYGFLSFIVAVSVGVVLGVIAALRQNSWLDYLAVGVSIGAQVLPNFVMAPILVLTFTLWLGWLPGGGWQGGELPYLILPVIALSTSFMASIARINTLIDAGSVERRFHIHRTRQGTAQTTLGFAPCAETRDVAGYFLSWTNIRRLITGSVVIDIYFQPVASANTLLTRRSTVIIP